MSFGTLVSVAKSSKSHVDDGNSMGKAYIKDCCANLQEDCFSQGFTGVLAIFQLLTARLKYRNKIVSYSCACYITTHAQPYEDN